MWRGSSNDEILEQCCFSAHLSGVVMFGVGVMLFVVSMTRNTPDPTTLGAATISAAAGIAMVLGAGTVYMLTIVAQYLQPRARKEELLAELTKVTKEAQMVTDRRPTC
jgi:hypothetical protein